MRLLQMRARWEPEQHEALLTQARTYSSAKYEAIALRGLGRHEEAAAVAAGNGSDLLLAQLGSPAQRRHATDRIAAALPVELRTSFVAAGRLSVALTADDRSPRP